MTRKNPDPDFRLRYSRIRMRRYRIRRKEEGICPWCPNKLDGWSLCDSCRVKANASARKRWELKRERERMRA